MAELAKKLYFKKAGVEQTAKAYSTTAEVGAEYIENKIDGVTCYVAIGDTTNSRATVGLVKKTNTSVDQAILDSGKPPYAEMQWTTAGTYTFTVPAGVTRIRVACCGGGGGGAVSSSGSVTAGSGTSSKFGDLMEATGGSGGYINGTSEGDSGHGGAGGTPNGNSGSFYQRQFSSYTGYGGQGFGLSFEKSSGTYGSGGGSRGMASSSSTGGSGGFNSGHVNVVPGNTYQVIVGNGGAAKGGSTAMSVYSGNSGFVLIAFGGDI